MWINALMKEWLLGLGEFETGEFNGDSQENYNVYNQKDYSNFVQFLLWAYFLAGTLLTQIILMNTLIAILGDTYEKITEKKQLYSLTQRTKLYANYITYIKFNPVVEQKYLYVIRPQPDDDDNQQWEGAVTSIKNRIKKSHESLAKDLSQLQEKIKDDNQSLRAEVNTVNKKFDSVNSELSEVKTLLKTLVEANKKE